MSRDYTVYVVYVGPYLECKVVKVPTTLVATCCVNHECLNFRVNFGGEQDPFCSKCGKEIGSHAGTIYLEEPDNTCFVDTEADDFVDISEHFQMLAGDCIERVMDDRLVHIYLPNEFRAPGLLFDPRDIEDVRELNPKSCVYDADRFKAQVDQTPAYLAIRDLYGPDALSWKWGVINYSN